MSEITCFIDLMLVIYYIPSQKYQSTEYTVILTDYILTTVSRYLFQHRNIWCN